MTETSEAGKRERLHLRLDAAAKRKLELAAAYSHKSLSDFVLSRAVQAADEIIEEHEKIVLDDAARDVFFAAILEPPKANKALRDALKWYEGLS